MEYTRLGGTGLKVSRVTLGCMSFGDTSRGFNQWALDDAAAEPLFRQAVELGITFWDTANAYGYGTSEEIVGRAIRKYTRREDVVLATKVYFKMGDGPGGSGLSRGRSWSRSTPPWPASARTTSTCTRSTASTRRRRPRRPWKRCTTWSRRARPATSVPP